jgi:hypothetical protein
MVELQAQVVQVDKVVQVVMLQTWQVILQFHLVQAVAAVPVVEQSLQVEMVRLAL